MRRGFPIEGAARAGLALLVYLVFSARLPNFHSALGLWALLDGSVMTGLVALGGAVAEAAFDRNLAAQRLHKPPHQRQTHPCSAL